MTDNHTIEAIPVAPLRLAAHISAEKLAKEVDAALVEYRRNDIEILRQKYDDSVLLRDFAPDTFLLDLECPRFGTGEAKAVFNESVRGVDEYILCDITNYSNTYTVSGFTNHMSPDDNYQDLKRIIGASISKTHRVNVIMPFLYEGRVHNREGRDSLDCAQMLKELGVTADTCYLYIQGHHLFDKVTLPMMNKVCDKLRREREMEIHRKAVHTTQMHNELSCYTHSIEQVSSMLKKNTGYFQSAPYRRLKDDIARFLKGKPKTSTKENASNALSDVSSALDAL